VQCSVPAGTLFSHQAQKFFIGYGLVTVSAFHQLGCGEQLRGNLIA
jgi:hypothetical protein